MLAALTFIQASTTLAFVLQRASLALPSVHSTPAVASSARLRACVPRTITMSAASPRALDISAVIEPTSGTHDSTVIFLHGSGDSGEGVRQWVQSTMASFGFEKTRIVFPTAPMRKYTLLGPHGMQRVWFGEFTALVDR